MDDTRQLFRGAFHLQRHHGLGNQLRRVRPDNVYAQNLSILGVGNNFDEAFVLAHDAGARVGSEGELANLDVVTLFLGLGFGQTDAAISGWQYVALGIRSGLIVLVGLPAMCVTATMPSIAPECASCG